MSPALLPRRVLALVLTTVLLISMSVWWVMRHEIRTLNDFRAGPRFVVIVIS